MTDQIYLIDPKTKTPVSVSRVSFADIGVRERQDLESWIVNHPEILGEKLLVISVEFHGFGRSNKRLDVLALDEDGVLVVVELKLDVAGSHADLQAIRYAAFCSTMTMQSVVSEYAATCKVTEDVAEERIAKFLECDELPEIGNRPRIVLAAGSIDDQEITSCVLWLRGFGVDINCVELSPYRMPDGSTILVPKVIIPLPETREYTIKVEKKEVARVGSIVARKENDHFWTALKTYFNASDCPLRVTANVAEAWMVLKGGNDSLHYAWWWLRREQSVRTGIGFRSREVAENVDRMNLFRPRQAELSAAIGDPLQFQDDWGPITRRLYVGVPFDGSRTADAVAKHAAEMMVKVVAATLPILVEHGLHPARS
jgi:hypothetical protein